MITLTKPRQELQTKLQNAKSMRKCANQLLEYLEEEVRAIEQKDLELKNGAIIRDFNENLLAEKDQQLLDKESIITEKTEKISQLEAKLADAEVKLNVRKAFMLAERKQEMKTKELQIQQLESQIKQAADLHSQQLARIAELKMMMPVKTQPICVEFGLNSDKQYEKSVEAAKNHQHEFGVYKDEEVEIMRTLVNEKERFIAVQQKQLESAENALKTNAKQLKKIRTELRNKDKELLNSKQLAKETMIREMKQLDLSDELKSILYSLVKETAKIAEKRYQKQYSSRYSRSTDETEAEESADISSKSI